MMPSSSGGPQLVDEGGATSAQSAYDHNGNLISFKGWVCTYDAQNRLRTARHNGTLIAEYYYDGKNRQIARNVGGAIRFSAWDNWELVEEYASGLNTTVSYLQGANGVIKSWGANGTFYYYRDKLGSTTHIAHASGQLLESYKYDLYGTPTYYVPGDPNARSASSFGIVDLDAGERWIPELALYDLRNRFMSPELGRFLQPDPIGFKGDPSNLYRYCHNDPENFTDPMGLTPFSRDEFRTNLTSWGSNKDWVTVFQADLENLSRLQAGPDGAGGGNDTVKFADTARKAADLRVPEVTKEAIAQSRLPTEQRREPYAAVGQAEGSSAKYAVSPVLFGKTLSDISKLKREGLAKKALRSDIGTEGLPRGYKLAGYVLGHVAFHRAYVKADINEAKKANLDVAIIVAPPRPGTNTSFYIPYEKGKPDPSY